MEELYTSAFIGKAENGNIKLVRVIMDGYPQHTGKVLQQAWRNPEDVDFLMSNQTIIQMHEDKDSIIDFGGSIEKVAPLNMPETIPEIDLLFNNNLSDKFDNINYIYVYNATTRTWRYIDKTEQDAPYGFVPLILNDEIYQAIDKKEILHSLNEMAKQFYEGKIPQREAEQQLSDVIALLAHYKQEFNVGSDVLNTEEINAEAVSSDEIKVYNNIIIDTSDNEDYNLKRQVRALASQKGVEK